MTVNFLCRVDEMDHRGPDTGPTITLGVSVQVTPAEVTI